MRRARVARFGTAETFAPRTRSKPSARGADDAWSLRRRVAKSDRARTRSLHITPCPSIECYRTLDNDIVYGPIPQHSAAGIVARCSGFNGTDGVIQAGATVKAVKGVIAVMTPLQGTLHKVFMPPNPMRTE